MILFSMVLDMYSKSVNRSGMEEDSVRREKVQEREMTGMEREKHRVRQQIERQTDGKGKEGMPLEKVEVIKNVSRLQKKFCDDCKKDSDIYTTQVIIYY